MTDTDSRRRRNRFLILWVVGSGLWYALVAILQAAIRPAPGFAVVAPILVGGPLLALAAGLLILRWRR
ncbi:MAG: hypothetical protein EAZ99_02985 [Alphaproteobacteria bacterium]|nr:hypothetical protein [Alphaproteobacteria bacterium]TAD91623.1 MAG: hypothetical protein EAZ99_02985 [Alphaproteobacteria bacterium]